MKRLLLLRHGEAEPAAAANSDFERALTPHGRLQALAAAHQLSRARHLPETMIVSPALRARETALIVAARLERVRALQFESTAYPGSPEALRQLIHMAPSESRTLLLVGHNPGLSDLARQLAARASLSSTHELPELCTGEIRGIELSGASWSQLDSAVVRVLRLP
jgi:phosphohistidine phosphatase